ncbi:hypothetical protein AVEN_156284-1 [Araneus ventricosus]|uniref:RING-type domain-containing protein n=1 Tax=Araneus ventricosus TaxID=182803 RepID=A0A4Y2UHZ5_ARAVE|nr:hypothetical protein AVEN_156284-1 [Araneus ventricosus]
MSLQNDLTDTLLDNQTLKCPICLLDLDNEQCYKLGCNHEIHIDCVDLWKKNHSTTCPCCHKNVSLYFCSNWYKKCALCKEKNHSRLTICVDCRIHLCTIRDLFIEINAENVIPFAPVSEATMQREYPDMFSNLSDREIYIQSLKIYALELLDLKCYFDQIDTTRLKSMSVVLPKIHFLLYFRDKKYRRDKHPSFLEDRWESRYLIHETKHKSYSHLADNESMKYIMEEYIRILFRFQDNFKFSSEYDEHRRIFNKLQCLMRRYESSLFRKALVSFIETIDEQILEQVDGLVKVYKENKLSSDVMFSELRNLSKSI